MQAPREAPLPGRTSRAADVRRLGLDIAESSVHSDETVRVPPRPVLFARQGRGQDSGAAGNPAGLVTVRKNQRPSIMRLSATSGLTCLQAGRPCTAIAGSAVLAGPALADEEDDLSKECPRGNPR